ncbi:MAG: cytidyltransferase [Flavobacteriaceae bacterium]|nr:cytidyltransferase [Flavobacteriaceae bacterium]|tara:strand:+ start:26717 stop:27148 length:432 start_codon:yes stop_codon:yes gene_type:complete
MKQLIIVSGYFNPIHKGHIEYFNLAKNMGDILFVIVNSDEQRKLKQSKEFMFEQERLLIVKNIKSVDYAMISIDKDKSVKDSIAYIHNKYKNEYNISFVNGGDQLNNISPEKDVCKKLGIKTIDGLGEKIQSSSWLLKKNNII